MAVVPLRTFVVSTTPTRIPQVYVSVGDTDHVGLDLTAIAALSAINGTPAWASSSANATVSGDAIAASIAKTIVVGVAEGDALLTCTVTTTDGHVLKRSICIHVRSPL